MKAHAGHIELAVAALFNYRTYSIVPNVYWGWGLRHEADLICVSKEMFVTEVEIKISASDLRADFRKSHKHQSKKIHRLVYAVPEDLVHLAATLCPPDAGIIKVVYSDKGYWQARWVRVGKKNKNNPITIQQYAELLRLGCMRIWSLKNHNNKKSTVFNN